MSISSTSRNASKLGDLLAQLPLNQPDQWKEIESTAQTLANDLRVKDIEQQTTLGRTLLPQTLTSLLKGAIVDGSIPEGDQKNAVNEILRVAANLCMDHDENRGALLESGFPQTVVCVLESYAEELEPANRAPLPLSIPDLRIVKTCVGALLNLSLGFEPVQTRLVSLEAALTILKLTIAIYPPGSWLHETHTPSEDPEDPETASVLEAWSLRSSLAAWALRAISELREEEDDSSRGNLPPRQTFTTDALPYLVRPLAAFVPPYPPIPPLFSTLSSRKSLVQTDFDILGEACGLLESLALDVEEIRLSLARGFSFPAEHGGVACLTDMLTFVDRGDYAPYWVSSSPASPSNSDPERAAKEKAFDICKAAIIKSIVEVAGDEKNIDVIWDDSEVDQGKPGGEFVQHMVQWLRTHKTLRESNRDDLIMCSTLSLGNLVRRDAHASAIINPPISLAPDLAEVLSPELNIKVKHGIIGLLKHLAQSSSNRPILGEARIIQQLAASEIWSDKADMVETVQVTAIGVAKHLCHTSIQNCFAIVLPENGQDPATTALQQILALGRRSDSVAVKSEGTRVIVNVVKTLWSHDQKDTSIAQKRKDAMQLIVNPQCAAALAQLIGRSKKYPMLVSEGVVALTLMSTHKDGGVIVLDSIMNPLPSEMSARGGTAPISAGGPLTGNGIDSPIVGPRRALDRLVAILRSSSPPIAAEVRANVCALVGHLGRKGVVPEDRARDLQHLKESLREILENATKEENQVAIAAKRALDAWAV
ncbi:hypothetical protein QCA50_003180 [Cerrena zonata]|uniref:Uncharacterized protein n=1 Tax=Cerrena zonata TaxID=2478898 RepID=A0AAW0GLK8_9APHY